MRPGRSRFSVEALDVFKIRRAADSAHQGQSRQKGWAAISRTARGFQAQLTGGAFGVDGLDPMPVSFALPVRVPEWYRYTHLKRASSVAQCSDLMPNTDEDAALLAITTLEPLSTEQRAALHAINAIVNNGEPFVDVHKLFACYDKLYFRNLLVPRVEVIWSPRLTLCAGICELSKDPVSNKFTRIRLKLSTPLLQYRPRSDTINTLLHEAIHAYFFITTSWKHIRGDDGTGHGAGFQLLADAINNHGNYDITIYHTFHDEVDSYRTHVWQCDGPCKTQPPYFGQVKRSMNRAPGRADTWWATHVTECGGTFIKISEPELTKKQLQNLSSKERAGRQKNKLDSWVTTSKKKDGKVGVGTTEIPDTHVREDETSNRVVGDVTLSGPSTGQKRSLAEDDDGLVVAKKALVECPICNLQITDTDINRHLDLLHP
ncbi:hypothetical protein OPT61_g10112 [Boeremia exigua]|uniref:Uncharacterized protein n=1 Tax=Boeremia exigua TaxID=749465 RepID=A0ACC2HSP3_9PLEO|nr:hypothetical protein OPT61_g10112 [Boeremia exigua]